MNVKVNTLNFQKRINSLRTKPAYALTSALQNFADEVAIPAFTAWSENIAWKHNLTAGWQSRIISGEQSKVLLQIVNVATNPDGKTYINEVDTGGEARYEPYDQILSWVEAKVQSLNPKKAARTIQEDILTEGSTPKNTLSDVATVVSLEATAFLKQQVRSLASKGEGSDIPF